jgi:hypothetical protein
MDFSLAGTFRPDRIRSIADRFGVDGNMALENILYGEFVISQPVVLICISTGIQQRTSGLGHSCVPGILSRVHIDGTDK